MYQHHRPADFVVLLLVLIIINILALLAYFTN